MSYDKNETNITGKVESFSIINTKSSNADFQGGSF